MGYFHSRINTPALISCQARDRPKERKIGRRRGRHWTPCAWWGTGTGDCSGRFHSWALRRPHRPPRWLLWPQSLPPSPPQRTCARTSGHSALSGRTFLNSLPGARWRPPPSPRRPAAPSGHNCLPVQTVAGADPRACAPSAPASSTLLIPRDSLRLQSVMKKTGENGTIINKRLKGCNTDLHLPEISNFSDKSRKFISLDLSFYSRHLPYISLFKLTGCIWKVNSIWRIFKDEKCNFYYVLFHNLLFSQCLCMQYIIYNF